jgi:hypothetical protein
VVDIDNNITNLTFETYCFPRGDQVNAEKLNSILGSSGGGYEDYTVFWDIRIVALMMQAVRTSEMSVDFNETKRRG